MDIFVRVLNAVLMIVMPIVLGVVLVRRFKLGWRIVLIGAGAFAFSQILHIPFNQFVLLPLAESLGLSVTSSGWSLVFMALLVGLSAGVFEELVRYVFYRTSLRDVRTMNGGMLFGAGHGGLEAILLGGLALVGFVQAVSLRGADLAAVVPAEQLALAEAQLAAYWSVPWFAALLGAVERGFAIIIQITLAVMVLQAFSRKNLLWLLLAILFHTLIDALAVYSLQVWGVYTTEALVGLLALASLAILVYLRRVEGPELTGEGVPPAADVLSLEDVGRTLGTDEDADLDGSRYSDE
jgi:uncharacterized membrane protein YhfC